MTFTSDQLKSCRHPKRKLIYPLITLLFLSVVGAILLLTTFRELSLSMLYNEVISEGLTHDHQQDKLDKIKLETLKPEDAKLFSNTGSGSTWSLSGLSLNFSLTDEQTPEEKIVEGLSWRQKDILFQKYNADPANADIVDSYNFFKSYGHFHMVFVLLAIYFLFLFYSIYGLYASDRASSVRIDKTQFPKAYALFEQMAKDLGFKKIPELYLKNGNGDYNAYAACVPGYRNFAAIYDTIFIAYENGGDENVFKFVVGHELWHIRLNHVSRWNIIILSLARLPIINWFLGAPMSRIQEYEADKIGSLLAPTDKWSTLLMLISGKDLYQKVDLESYVRQDRGHTTFANIFANFNGSHPIVPWRIQAIRDKEHGWLIFPNKPKEL